MIHVKILTKIKNYAMHFVFSNLCVIYSASIDRSSTIEHYKLRTLSNLTKLINYFSFQIISIISGEFFAKLFKAAIHNNSLEEVKAVNQVRTFPVNSHGKHTFSNELLFAVQRQFLVWKEQIILGSFIFYASRTRNYRCYLRKH